LDVGLPDLLDVGECVGVTKKLESYSEVNAQINNFRQSKIQNLKSKIAGSLGP
jgi:hypothetical protein